LIALDSLEDSLKLIS